jgi:hypothetical protein
MVNAVKSFMLQQIQADLFSGWVVITRWRVAEEEGTRIMTKVDEIQDMVTTMTAITKLAFITLLDVVVVDFMVIVAFITLLVEATDWNWRFHVALTSTSLGTAVVVAW